MAITANQGLPIPVGADAPAGHTQITALAYAMERIGVMVFATAAARTTKLIAPTEGMLCWLQDVNRFERYDGSAWVEMPDLTKVNTLIATALTSAVLRSATGSAVLVAGTKVVTLASVTAVSRIFLTTIVPGGTPGWLQVSARAVGTSFTILSSSATDTSTVAWMVVEP